jgi:hypothetical protein
LWPEKEVGKMSSGPAKLDGFGHQTSPERNRTMLIFIFVQLSPENGELQNREQDEIIANSCEGRSAAHLKSIFMYFNSYLMQ